ncbi:DNA primase [Candidatus Uhrbacteria bacterium]|nr:DNA primase [Candidatus Uhrbacteria bacterium]
MDAVADIKGRLDIVDIVSEYIPVKPGGSGAFKANCPFHQERTPSFYVSRPRQTWHCFGCDQGGDLISFVMKMEGMEFREALELLAQKAGVTLPAFDGEKASMKKRTHEVNELAMKFFKATLERAPEAEAARAYVKKRGLDDLTLDLFGIGFAPESWDALTKALTAKGVTEQEMLQAGVVAKSERGPGVYDRFRNRVMFPIADVHGNIVGFTGRILSDDKKEAKYVNTPETSAYRKSAVLYGLDKAKGEIRREDLAVIVEGNMDVVGSHQFSVLNVVASSGTALTAEQLGLLKRFTTNIAIAFDQDNAGTAATIRGLDLARVQDFNIKIITLPPEAGKDPDDAVRKDPQLWRDAIKNAVGIMDWVYRNAFRNRHPEKPEDKKIIARDILTEIKRIVDPVERDHWVKKLAKDLDVSEGALREALQGIKKQEIGATRAPEAAKEEEKEEVSKMNQFEERVLANLLVRFELLKQGMEEERLAVDDFEHPEARGLYEGIRNAYAAGEMAPDPLAAGQAVRPPASLGPVEAKTYDDSAFLAEREFQGWTLEQLKRELKTGVLQLRLQRKKRERERLEQQMREAERLGDQERIAELLRQFDALT